MISPQRREERGETKAKSKRNHHRWTQMNTDFTGANGGNGDGKAPSSNSDKLRKSSRVESRAGLQIPKQKTDPNPNHMRRRGELIWRTVKFGTEKWERQKPDEL